MAKKKDEPARPVAGRLGPPPETILRGGTHADKRRKPRNEEKRLAIREALSSSGALQSPPRSSGIQARRQFGRDARRARG
jgi:hypothetical protein